MLVWQDRGAGNALKYIHTQTHTRRDKPKVHNKFGKCSFLGANQLAIRSNRPDSKLLFSTVFKTKVHNQNQNTNTVTYILLIIEKKGK